MEILLVALIALVLWGVWSILGVVSLTINKQVTGLVSGGESVALTDNEGIIASPASVLAAQPGVLTTHTTNTTGTMTMTNTSHGLTTGQRVDIYWTGGQCYGAVLGTVSGTTVPIASVSGGSNLPSSSTPIIVGVAQQVGFGVTGNNLTALVLTTPQSGYFVFNNGSSDVFAQYVQAGRIYTWDTTAPDTNPLAGATPTSVWISHSYITAAVTSIQAGAVTH